MYELDASYAEQALVKGALGIIWLFLSFQNVELQVFYIYISLTETLPSSQF